MSNDPVSLGVAAYTFSTDHLLALLTAPDIDIVLRPARPGAPCCQSEHSRQTAASLDQADKGPVSAPKFLRTQTSAHERHNGSNRERLLLRYKQPRVQGHRNEQSHQEYDNTAKVERHPPQPIAA